MERRGEKGDLQTNTCELIHMFIKPRDVPVVIVQIRAMKEHGRTAYCVLSFARVLPRARTRIDRQNVKRPPQDSYMMLNLKMMRGCHPVT